MAEQPKRYDGALQPESPTPEQPQPVTIARPAVNPNNPYDDAAQKTVREAERNASSDPFPKRSAGGPVPPPFGPGGGK